VARELASAPLQIIHARTPRKIAFGALLASAFLLTASFCIDENMYALQYRAGALVFGGGHVVLPLLNDSIVTGGFVFEQNFLVT
jgi:chromate transporter